MDSLAISLMILIFLAPVVLYFATADGPEPHPALAAPGQMSLSVSSATMDRMDPETFAHPVFRQNLNMSRLMERGRRDGVV
jgi:hypothetical protein